MVGLKIAQNDKSRGERVSCFILREYRADGKQREFAQFSRALANGHIMLNTPVLVRSLKLSNKSVLGWVTAWEHWVLLASQCFSRVSHFCAGLFLSVVMWRAGVRCKCFLGGSLINS
jgi:hypothetical protein